MSTEQQGTPYPSLEAGPIDQWSERIYAALGDWPIAQAGAWTRWEPGYVLLTISSVRGDLIEPISLYSADEELTVEFGFWETHLPEPPLDTLDPDPSEAASQAKALIEDWLTGRIRTAVFLDKDGKWCGSKLVEGEDIIPQLATDWIKDFGPVKVEVRAPHRANWRHFAIRGNRILEVL